MPDGSGVVLPIAKNIVLSAAIIVLSLAGAALQDRKKAWPYPEGRTAWQSRTNSVPLAAITRGRATFGGFGVHALLGGLAVWLIATRAHIPLSGWPADTWRWAA